jgi:hypothetical protein
VLAFLAGVGDERQVMERAGRCLKLHQDPRSGGVATYADPRPIRRYIGGGHIDVRGWCASHLEVTATAGRAFAAVPDNRFRAEALLAWRYVDGRQARDGSWSSYWWTDRHYPTLQAATLGAAMGDQEPTTRAAAWLTSEQLPGGAWSATGVQQSAFATALSLAVAIRAGGHDDAVRRGVHGLVSLRQADGGWPGDATMRIPPPQAAEPDDYESWRVDGLGTGVVVHDHRRLFTTSVCVSTLALALASHR